MFTRICLALCVGLGALLPARAAEEKPVTPEEEYRGFLAQLGKAESIKEFMTTVDRVVDQAEQSQGVGAGVIGADTKLGLHVEMSVISTDEAIIYYASLSRRGALLRYTDAATLFALLTDRAGLTHPVDMTEGERPYFYARWLIKPKEWKALQKKMLEVRAANRAISDPGQALPLAVNRELEARRNMKKRE